MIQIKGNWETREVTLIELETGNAQVLDPKPSQKIINHSPDGFNWGYGGSGPAQLALAILLKFEDKEFARNNYQKFKWDIVANLPQSNFVMTDQTIQEWLSVHLKEEVLANDGTRTDE